MCAFANANRRALWFSVRGERCIPTLRAKFCSLSLRDTRDLEIETPIRAVISLECWTKDLSRFRSTLLTSASSSCFTVLRFLPLPRILARDLPDFALHHNCLIVDTGTVMPTFLSSCCASNAFLDFLLSTTSCYFFSTQNSKTISNKIKKIWNFLSFDLYSFNKFLVYI